MSDVIEFSNDNYTAIVDLKEVAAMNFNHSDVPRISITYRRGETCGYPLRSKEEGWEALNTYRQYLKRRLT